jgi:hypothetical protein
LNKKLVGASWYEWLFLIILFSPGSHGEGRPVNALAKRFRWAARLIPITPLRATPDFEYASFRNCAVAYYRFFDELSGAANILAARWPVRRDLQLRPFAKAF